MPWFPDFVGAVELARRDTQIAGRDDPVAQYLRASNRATVTFSETVWPGQVVVNDPLVGEVRGHKELRHFVSRNQSWLAEHHARTETVAATYVSAKEPLSSYWPPSNRMDRSSRGRSPWSPSPPTNVRSCSAPTAARGHTTDIATCGLPSSNPGAHEPDDVVGRYQTALDAGDTDGIVRTFQSGRVLSRTYRSPSLHRGTDELRAFFLEYFRGGGLTLELVRDHRRRPEVRRGIQLRPLGVTRHSAPGGHCHLRTGGGWAPGCGSGL